MARGVYQEASRPGASSNPNQTLVWGLTLGSSNYSYIFIPHTKLAWRVLTYSKDRPWLAILARSSNHEHILLYVFVCYIFYSLPFVFFFCLRRFSFLSQRRTNGTDGDRTMTRRRTDRGRRWRRMDQALNSYFWH